MTSIHFFASFSHHSDICFFLTVHLPMPNHLCDVSLLPDTFQSCYIPCPVDCIVSSWGPWDHCRASECSQLGLKKHKGKLIVPFKGSVIAVAKQFLLVQIPETFIPFLTTQSNAIHATTPVQKHSRTNISDGNCQIITIHTPQLELPKR